MVARYYNYITIAQKIIEQVGKTIVMGIPLGLGKPIGITNALYRLACEDPTLQLTIMTGLTLARPIPANELEKRLVDPILERILKDYEDPLYERDRVLQQVPANIKIIEFFLSPAKYLHNSYVQQNFVSSNYAHVGRDAVFYSMNVLAQQVAHSKQDADLYSLSCNSDLFQETADYLRGSGRKIAIVAEVNEHLPFMHGEAIVKAENFTDIVDTKRYRSLFALPRDALSAQDHLIGMYTSCLIKDNGCLQIGIGKLSNAVAAALIMRHQHNDVYNDLLAELQVKQKFGDSIAAAGGTNTFDKGLYASTEMLSDEYIQLYKAGILKKLVYDNVFLQRLINNGEIDKKITPALIDLLLKNKAIHSPLHADEFEFLKKFGIFKSDILYQDGSIVLSSGERIPANLTSESSRQKILNQCLGTTLTCGKILHAGFFLGSVDLYQSLRNLSSEELELMDMTRISRTNSLLWSPALLTLQRKDGRFVNSAMMVTLGGGVISDGLKNLQEISGVGGQFDFVNMAHNLEDGKSIINCHSTRISKKGLESNIIWDYPNLTIARYLRDIMVTEYGIADCASKTDNEVIKSILNITDSRFQQKLLKIAKKNGKLEQHYEIPAQFQQNLPENFAPIIREMQTKGYCLPYPFGSDLTDDENVIANALLFIDKFSKIKLLLFIVSALLYFKADKNFIPYLKRMNLLRPKSASEFIYKKILKLAVSTTLLKV